MKYRVIRRLAVLLAWTLTSAYFVALPPSSSSIEKALSADFGNPITIKVDGLKTSVWLALTPKQQQKGLMRVRRLTKNTGMLFYYDEPRRICMWMKNTLIPLSVAFADEQGEILNIAQMTPHTTTSHCSETKAAQYALEMNQGWFKRYGIQVGDTISLGDQAVLSNK